MNHLILIVIILLFERILLTIISKSNIEKCTKSNKNETLNCTNKLVTSLSIENGKLSDTDYMEIFISEALEDNSKSPKRIQNPYKITISKTPVKSEYPCIYLQDFNYKPVEMIIISDVFSCNDGDLSPNPTCGWSYSTKEFTKTVIPYSQGFCCKCDFSQIIGIDTTSRTRGSSCGLLNLGSGSATAHCLRFDQLWYAAYEVKKYKINYEIEISVTYKNNSNITDEFVIEKLTLSPSKTISISSNSNIKAQLIGDFQPSTPPNDYSDFYLIMPSYPETHSMVREGPLNWMLINKNQFSLDGRECNKIGVGYNAFRFQGGSAGGCNMKAGECLFNQIYDFYLEDIKRISQNKNPKYLLAHDKTIKYDFYSYSQEDKKFAYKLNGIYNSLITLEIKADDLRFVTNVSNGVIDYVTIETFEAVSNDGSMELQVTNSGTLTAMFFLSYNCSDFILPILADEISLNAFQSQIIRKDIYTFNQNFRIHLCNVTLKNSEGEDVDFKSSQFNSTKKIVVNNQNLNLNDTQNDNVVNSTGIATDYIILECNILCPEFFDFVCFFAHNCWGYFIRILLIMLAILIFVIVLIKWIKNGGPCKFADKIIGWCLDDDVNKKENKINL